MKKQIISILVSSLFLTACAGPGQLFEETRYGVRQSVWIEMSESQKLAAINQYREEQRRKAEEARLEAVRERRRLEETRIARQREENINRMADRAFNLYYQNHNYDSDFNYNYSSKYTGLSSLERDIYKRRIAELQENRLRKFKREQKREQERQERAAIEEAKRRSRETYRKEQIRRLQEEAISSYSDPEEDAIREAKKRSIETHRREEARRAQERELRRAQEEHDLAEAKRRSMETYRREQAQRKEQQKREEQQRREEARARAQEERDLAEAKRRSMETYRQEQARNSSLSLQEQEDSDLQEAIRRSMETYQEEESRRASSSSSSWSPNEGHLVAAGRHVMDLQSDLGEQPSMNQMVSCLTSKMNINSSQAKTIIDELGLY